MIIGIFWFFAKKLKRQREIYKFVVLKVNKRLIS